jgi:hypothetical protein
LLLAAGSIASEVVLDVVHGGHFDLVVRSLGRLSIALSVSTTASLRFFLFQASLFALTEHQPEYEESDGASNEHDHAQLYGLLFFGLCCAVIAVVVRLSVLVVRVIASNVAFDHLGLQGVDIAEGMVHLRTHENSVLGTNGFIIVGDILGANRLSSKGV